MIDQNGRPVYERQSSLTISSVIGDRLFQLSAMIVKDGHDSVINIFVDDVDITDKVIFSTATFESQASALPGQFSFTVKDVNRTMEFDTGAEVRLEIDGAPMYGGIVMQIGRSYPFPVLDTSDITKVPRYIELSGVDYNVWFDKLVIRNPNNYLRGIYIKGEHYDGWYIRHQLPKYLDLPNDLNVRKYVDDIELFGSHEIPAGKNKGKKKITGIRLHQQGDRWRSQMESFAARSAAVYYIDADKNLHFHSQETSIAPWSLTDYMPDGQFTVGCREVQVTQDGSPIVNDALVWGGMKEMASYQKDPNGENSGIFFARRKDDDSIATHGRWQLAEVDFQRGDNQKSVNLRAKSIVNGKYAGDFNGTPTGLAYPVWSITATWFGHNVPRRQHVRPGQAMNIFLYAMGSDRYHPLIKTLPLRSLTMRFPSKPNEPNKTYVEFTGQFGIQYSDSRHMWRFLKKQQQRWRYVLEGDVSNASESAGYGTVGRFYPNETPDGLRTDFTIPFSYISGSTVVELNGLRQETNFQYYETDPEAGEIRFFSAPLPGDKIYIRCRTAES